MGLFKRTDSDSMKFWKRANEKASSPEMLGMVRKEERHRQNTWEAEEKAGNNRERGSRLIEGFLSNKMIKKTYKYLLP